MRSSWNFWNWWHSSIIHNCQYRWKLPTKIFMVQCTKMRYYKLMRNSSSFLFRGLQIMEHQRGIFWVQNSILLLEITKLIWKVTVLMDMWKVSDNLFNTVLQQGNYLDKIYLEIGILSKTKKKQKNFSLTI